MSISILLASLEEYLEVKKDFSTGCACEDDMANARKRFAESLNKYIDWRTDGVLEERRKRINTGDSIKIAEVLSSSFESKAEAIGALNTAPNPPKEGFSSEEFDRWVKTYREWYSVNRKRAIK